MSVNDNPFSIESLGFDPNELTKRYAAERENAYEKTPKRNLFNSRTIHRLPTNIWKRTLIVSLFREIPSKTSGRLSLLVAAGWACSQPPV